MSLYTDNPQFPKKTLDLSKVFLFMYDYFLRVLKSQKNFGPLQSFFNDYKQSDLIIFNIKSGCLFSFI